MMMGSVEVLEALKIMPRMSPSMISKKLEINAQYVRNDIRVLSELKLVKKPAHGIYEITSLGEVVLAEVNKNGQ